jgi:hypothetical protein
MPLVFPCPHCGKQTSATDDRAGQTVPCAECGQTVSVPVPSPAPTEGPPEPPAGRGCGCGTVVVVLLLLVLLVALLLPAVQAAREAARRTQCNNNLHNLALSLQNYHDTYKLFPMGAMHAGPPGDSARIGPSWLWSMLPFVECRNLYDRIWSLQRPGAPGNGAFNAQNVNAQIPGFLDKCAPEYMRCPSSPLPRFENQIGPIFLPTYVGIAGGCDVAAGSPDYQTTAGVPSLAPTTTREYFNRQKGVGHVPGGIITASGLLPPCQQVGVVDCTDGTSNTMIVGEQSDWLQDVGRDGSPPKYHGDAGWDTEGTGPPVASTTAGGGFLSGTIASLPVPLAIAGRPATPSPVYDC